MTTMTTVTEKTQGRRSGLLGLVAALALLAPVSLSAATMRRTTPVLSLDPGARIGSLYAFRSWVDPDKLVLIMTVAPGQEPGDAPMYFPFDDSVLYRFNIDNDKDGVASDVAYEVRFMTEQRPALGRYAFIQPYLGHPDIPFPELQGITALDGFGSEGITERQTYEVVEVTRGRRRRLFEGQRLVAVPPDPGPNTIPHYEELAAKGIYTDALAGVRVFAGPRAQTLYADINALFDTGNLRGFPLLTPEQEANDFANPFGVNNWEGFNVNSIALEIPISRVTRDHRGAETSAQPMLGLYASTSRSRGADPSGQEQFVQVDRMANPIVDVLLMDTPAKNAWHTTRPENDAQFLFYFVNPSPPRFPTTPYVFKIPSPPPPRMDVVRLFLKYPGQEPVGESCGSPCAELLRLDVHTAPTPADQQKRMGSLLGGDPAGLPNGNRPNDDAMDFGVRVIGGPAPIAAHLSDGVNFAVVPGAGVSDGVGYGIVPGNHLDVTPNGIAKEFPFQPSPNTGRDHHHSH